MAQQLIGIMLNLNLLKQINTGKTRFENILYYEKAAKSHGVVPCFFHLKAVDLADGRVSAYIKDHKSGIYKKRRVPIPHIIHNRAMLLKKTSHRIIDKLIAKGYVVFNHRTRYGKLSINKMLMENEQIVPHLPDTARADEKTVRSFMQKYGSIILKPNSSSIGLGILKLEKKGRMWVLTYPKTKFGKTGKIKFRKRLPELLLRKMKNRTYLVQERIPLATYEGRPFDLRVSVQRNLFGEWQVTGIAGRVAAKNKYVTNVAQGGRVFSLPELLEGHSHLDVETVAGNVIKISTQIAEELSMRLPNLADIGLDIGVDQNGFPYFIECNARDLRISFKKGNMLDIWESAFENPIGYACFLMKQLKDDRKEDENMKQENAG